MSCLLVLLVLLGASSPALGMSVLSQELMQQTDSLAQELKLTQPDVITQPLFSQVHHILNTSCPSADRAQLITATLDVYTGIFSKVLHQHSDLLRKVPVSRRPQVKRTLQLLQQRMQRLNSSLSHPTHQGALDHVRTIKMDDVGVQRRALAEFKDVYQTLSLVGHSCGHAHSSSAH